MRKRRNDFKGLTCLLCLFLRRQKTHGPHVVEAISHLDHQDPGVLAHRYNHLPDCFGFRSRPKRYFVEFGHAVDKAGDFRTEVVFQIVDGIVGVFHRVMQKCRNQRGGVHANLGGDGGHSQRV